MLILVQLAVLYTIRLFDNQTLLPLFPPYCWLVFSLCWPDIYINSIGLCTSRAANPLVLFLPLLIIMEKGTGWTDWKSNCPDFLLILHSESTKLKPSLRRTREPSCPVLFQWVCGGGSTVERKGRREWEGGGDRTTAKWLWHTRPNLLSCRTYILGLVADVQVSL